MVEPPGRSAPTTAAIERARWRLLRRLERALELPMAILGFLWLALLLLELGVGAVTGLVPATYVIWIFFLLDFVVKFWLAPRRIAYLRHNWLTAVALAIPALRVFRAAQAVAVLRTSSAVRGLRVLRLLTSLNRSMRVLTATLRRRGFGFMVAVTAVVVLTGATGMYALERGVPGAQIGSFGTALWWTAMLLMSFGTDVWPQSAAGRVLGVFLAIYGFGIFGYVTATLASYFINLDAENSDAEPAGKRELRALQREIEALRKDLARNRDGDGKS